MVPAKPTESPSVEKLWKKNTGVAGCGLVTFLTTGHVFGRCCLKSVQWSFWTLRIKLRVRCKYTPDLLEMVSFYWKWCHSLWKLQLGVGFNGFHLSPHQGRSNFLKNSSGIMGKHFGSCCKWAQYRLQQLRAYIDHKEEWDWISYASTRKLGTGPHSWQPSIDDPQRCQVSKHAQVGVKDSLGGPIYKVVSSVLHCCFLLTKTAFQPTSVFYPERTAFAIQNLVLRFLLRSTWKTPCQTGSNTGVWSKTSSHPFGGRLHWPIFGRGPSCWKWPIDLIPTRMRSKEIPGKIHRRWATSCYPINGQKYINKLSVPKGWNISSLFRWRIS